MPRSRCSGCGAIGSLYAAHLARVAGVEVWAVDPWREHVEAIAAGGLRVTGLADFVAAGARPVTDAADLPPCELGIVATKALHTRDAVAAARPALADAAVVSVQNGVGNEELIAELVPRVMRGTIVTAGRGDRARRGALRRARGLLDRPVRAEPGPRRTRSRRSRRLLTAGGLARTRWPTPAARSGRRSCSTPPPARCPRSPG